ncbi:MAG: nickel pincer cofactor biosynthesis protein LarC [Butyrivibrio sp.]|nr:nickel pincer cofactor biosynthesis protein LarC [Butyrivibrio sp.]
MKILYLECKMGIAGDMFASSLLDLFDDREKKIEELNAMNVPGVTFSYDRVQKCGIMGGHITVRVDGVEEESQDMHSALEHASDTDLQEHNDHHHGHTHRTLYDIEDIIEGLNVANEIKSDIREIYQLMAMAESRVHGTAVSEIHFHEVGSLDAVADIAAVCLLLHDIDPDKIVVSPINVGSGEVRTSHGILPVPAPATAILLTDVPNYSSDRIAGELCTPTGAALVKYFAFEFGSQPVMMLKKIGYGMGKKDFDQVNCVRAMLGEGSDEVDRVVELTCNMDDMTPEDIGYAKDKLFEEGALEVFTISTGMKKNRPGILLECICKEDKKEALLKAIFRHTSTIGIRESMSDRYILTREIESKDTPYGKVRIKKSTGFEVKREKFEYEDLAGIATRTGKSILELRKELEDYLRDE